MATKLPSERKLTEEGYDRLVRLEGWLGKEINDCEALLRTLPKRDREFTEGCLSSFRRVKEKLN